MGEKKNKELVFNGYRVLVWKDKNVQEIDGSNGYIAMWVYLLYVHLKLLKW